ncbi:MAG TPA: cyclic nucleotide-binding domain-containing protein [Thermoanaerobaculia bacterium]|nr:cyclic nucleotide-binding domain-containing protein [Thermoanaerobaculia bacterium]
MAFKSWFKGSGGAEPQAGAKTDLTIEDLIVLERYDEAETRLKAQLRNDPDDLYAHLKLAEAYGGLGRAEAAADQYLHVAEEYARDGFYDKGIALLQRAQRANPGDERLRLKLYAFEQAKGMEHKRNAAIEGLRQSRHAGAGSGTRVLQLQRIWHHLAPTPLLRRLSVDNLRRLFAAAEPVQLVGGHALAGRGEADGVLWVLLSGTVDALLERGAGEPTPLRSFGPGDVIGDEVGLRQGNWPATYRVAEAGLFLRLDRSGLEHALTGNSDPRGFLDALRQDGNDADITRMVAKLEARP